MRVGVHTLKRRDMNVQMHANHAQLYLHCQDTAGRSNISTLSLNGEVEELKADIVQHNEKHLSKIFL